MHFFAITSNICRKRSLDGQEFLRLRPSCVIWAASVQLRGLMALNTLTQRKISHLNIYDNDKVKKMTR